MNTFRVLNYKDQVSWGRAGSKLFTKGIKHVKGYTSLIFCRNKDEIKTNSPKITNLPSLKSPGDLKTLLNYRQNLGVTQEQNIQIRRNSVDVHWWN